MVVCFHHTKEALKHKIYHAVLLQCMNLKKTIRDSAVRVVIVAVVVLVVVVVVGLNNTRTSLFLTPIQKMSNLVILFELF